MQICLAHCDFRLKDVGGKHLFSTYAISLQQFVDLFSAKCESNVNHTNTIDQYCKRNSVQFTLVKLAKWSPIPKRNELNSTFSVFYSVDTCICIPTPSPTQTETPYKNNLTQLVFKLPKQMLRISSGSYCSSHSHRKTEL